MDAKLYLCKTVDRLFPDLNFSQKEQDAYDEESSKMELPFDAESDKGIKSAYIWRDMLVDNMICQKNESNKIETPDFKSVPDANLSDDEFVAKTLADAFSSGGTKSETLVEKFKPFSYSPKSLDDIVGLKDSVEDIKDSIILPLKDPEAARIRKEEYGLDIPGFAIFFGPPGCGKTMLAEAIAAETGCDMYTLDLSKFGSSYVNGTSTNVAKAFEYVKEQAKKSDKPVLLFMDELDSVLKARSSEGDSAEDNKVVNALLPMLTQAKENNILIIGATNRYDMLDSAAKRRMNFKCYIGLPSEKEIAKLLSNKLSDMTKGAELSEDKEALEKISSKLKGYSPSNINDMINDAAKIACKNNRAIKASDFDTVLKEGVWEKIDESEYLPENKQKPKNPIGFRP